MHSHHMFSIEPILCFDLCIKVRGAKRIVRIGIVVDCESDFGDRGSVFDQTQLPAITASDAVRAIS